MKYSFFQLIDLPDEVLMIIFKRLDNVDVFISLMGINTRLDQIICDPVFTRRLTLLRWSSTNLICPLDNNVLDRFCLQIIPQICHKIQWLNLESSSVERVLLAANYPNLCGLGLHHFQEQTAIDLFKNKNLVCMLKKQITSLVITMNDDKLEKTHQDLTTPLFIRVFNMFSNLCKLNFHSHCKGSNGRLYFETLGQTLSSSTLTELHVNVCRPEYCLFLLDGRFTQLHTFYVTIPYAFPPPRKYMKQENLPNLKCFSLICEQETGFYTEFIIPLLHRMANLEKLALYFAVYVDTFIDGDHLKKHILNHMPRLNKFIYNICSIISLTNQTYLPSIEHIQDTLTDLGGNENISSVDYFPKTKTGLCHIYSHPYTMRSYNKVTNNFPDGLFKYVQKISLFDERPFEHQFFIRISQAFPFLKKLSLTNETQQKRKQLEELNNENKQLSIVKFVHLTELSLIDVHDDYIAQFLMDTKTCLETDLRLNIDNDILERVAHNFNQDAIRVNCGKVKYLHNYSAALGPLDDLYVYFPNAIIV